MTLLKPFIGFRSISTDSAFAAELDATADWLSNLFENHGFEVSRWSASGLNPVICARYVKNPDLPTVLVYGHYDVQPAEEADGWLSPPFTLTQRQGRLYGRGVVDNKGQVLIHIATVLELMRTQRLAPNVTFLLEGNEETGSAGLAALLQKHTDALCCDQVLVSDGATPYRPTIEVSLRGGCNIKVRYTTAASSLHSGIYGGGVPNAAQELSRLIASFYDEHHHVTIPGFYDDVAPLTSKQKETAEALYAGDANLIKAAGIKQLVTEPDYGFGAAVGLRPTLQVSGINGGYTGEGFANIVPATAEVRINVRTVAPQQTTKVYQAIVTAITARTPGYVEVRIEQDMANEPVRLATDSPLIDHTRRLLLEAYGSEPVFSYSGGSIPIVGEFQTLLGVDPLLVNLGNDDCNMHGINENFELGLLKQGLAFSKLFFSQPIK